MGIDLNLVRNEIKDCNDNLKKYRYKMSGFLNIDAVIKKKNYRNSIDQIDLAVFHKRNGDIDVSNNIYISFFQSYKKFNENNITIDIFLIKE